MNRDTFTCPRCFQTRPTRAEAKFCPHCGLADAQDAAADTSPMNVTVGRTTYSIQERIAIGSVCTIYRCQFAQGARQIEGVCKIARDPRANSLVANEADILRRLHSLNPGGEFIPFLPAVEASFALGDGSTSLARQGTILRTHGSIASPDELYTLFEVHGQYPGGLDPRDAAWIWRRLLNILGFVHSQLVVHGAVLPMHVLIEPREHKLVLIDWCCAVRNATTNHSPLRMIAGGFKEWYKKESASTFPPTPALDIAMASRCMIGLMGGDPVRADFPPTVDPAVRRHFHRCLEGGSGAAGDAWKLLNDFDVLIEAMWGPRQFRPLPMPPKT